MYLTDVVNRRIRRVSYDLGVGNVDPSKTFVSVYPNPTNGNCSVEVMSDKKEPVTLSIRNILGVEIMRLGTETHKRVELALAVPDGIYYLTAITNDKITAQRLVIE